MAHFIQSFICITFLFSVANGINFFSRPASFYEGDKNVEITCNLVNDTAATFSEIIIQKKSSFKWTTVAEITSTKTVNKDINIIVSGNVGRSSESFLQITWPVAATSNFGTYRCEAVGKSLSGDHALRKSPELFIFGTPRNMPNLFDLIRNGDKDIVQKVGQAVSRTVKQEANEGQHFVKAAAARKQLVDNLAKLQTLVEGSVMAKLADLITRITNLEKSVSTLDAKNHH